MLVYQRVRGPDYNDDVIYSIEMQTQSLDAGHRVQ